MKQKLKSNSKTKFLKREISKKTYACGYIRKKIEDYYYFYKADITLVRVTTIYPTGKYVRWEKADDRGGVASLSYWLNTANY